MKPDLSREERREAIKKMSWEYCTYALTSMALFILVLLVSFWVATL